MINALRNHQISVKCGKIIAKFCHNNIFIKYFDYHSPSKVWTCRQLENLKLFLSIYVSNNLKYTLNIFLKL